MTRSRRPPWHRLFERAWLAVVLSALALGCAAQGEPVKLAVRTDPYTPYCHTFETIGTLVPDADAGTAIVEDADRGGRTVPVQWPEGFTARRFAGVTEVMNQDGTVIAQTGKHYRFAGGYGEIGWRGCDSVSPQ